MDCAELPCIVSPNLGCPWILSAEAANRQAEAAYVVLARAKKDEVAARNDLWAQEANLTQRQLP